MQHNAIVNCNVYKLVNNIVECVKQWLRLNILDMYKVVNLHYIKLLTKQYLCKQRASVVWHVMFFFPTTIPNTKYKLQTTSHVNVFFSFRKENTTGRKRTASGSRRILGQAGQTGRPAASDLVFVSADLWPQDEAKPHESKDFPAFSLPPGARA